jgi:hypothetical protein
VFNETTIEEAGGAYWCPADERDGVDLAPSISGGEWVALLKVASCDWTIELSDLACLLERKLIEKREGVLSLTERGRVALGIPV